MSSSEWNAAAPTMTLSVSKKSLSCEAVARFLQSQNIHVLVRANTSTMPGGVESGCQIMKSVDHGGEVKKLWQLVSREFGFGCGHVKIDGRFSGCVLDFIRPSACPGVSKELKN